MSQISNERAVERTTRVAALLRQVVYCRNEADVLGLRLAHYLLDVAGAELASVQDMGLKTADGVDLRVAEGRESAMHLLRLRETHASPSPRP